jgi:Pro-kumamolisin, activation domain/Bacterial Ig-like domain (group 3)
MRLPKLGYRFIPLMAASLLTFSAGGASAQTQPVRARITETVDETNRVQLRGNVHPLARPEFDQGVVADSQPMNRMLLLLQRSPEQQAALSALMEEQLAKSSLNYHKWLTPEEFGKQFGPADADIRAVTDWLTSHGFQASKVSKGRTVIEFSGNAGQVRDAFHTELHKFNAKGEEHVANVSDPGIPAALTPVVGGVVNLHNFRPKSFLHTAGTFRRNAKTGEVKPAFTFTDVNGTFYAVGPADFAKIYNINTITATGAGQSIAIVGQSNINLQDVADFRNAFGLPTYTSMCNSGLPPQCQFSVILNGPDPGLVSGDETESDLDVEWAGAVAQQAQIIFVTTQTTLTDFTAGVDASALYIVDNNVAPVLSESYGDCEANLGTTGNAFYNSLWQQAAAEGITVVIAAGDNGSAGCDPAPAPANQNAATQGLAVSGFASTPFNVAMGGTDFDDANNQALYWNTANTSTTPPVPASAKGYIPESTWNDTCASTAMAGNVSGLCTTVNSSGIDLLAGSGGPSSCTAQTSTGACSTGYPKPTWQQGGITPGDGARDIPDVSLFSSDGGPTSAPTKSFYIVCESDQDITGDTGCNLTTFTTTAPFHDFQAVGGTSAATPTFAAIIALINQTTGQRQGNANYALYHTYSLAKTAGKVCNSSSLTGTQLTSNPCVFYDTTKGNVSVACVGGSPNCSNTSGAANQFGIMATTNGGATPAFGATAGYDRATGLGSVNVANLLAAWSPPSRTSTSTMINPSSVSTSVDSSVTFSGSVAGAGSTPTGLVVIENMSTGAAIDNTSLSSGNYSLTTKFLPGGAYTIIAHYGGDGTFAASNSSPVPVTVTPQGSKSVVSFITFSANGTPIFNTGAISVQYGSPYVLRIDVENSSGQNCQNTTTFAIQFVCPTGTVALTNNGMPLNDFPNAQTPNATNVANLNNRGFAEDQPIQLPASSTPYNIVAAYSGDNSYNPSTSSPENVTITQAATTTAVMASPTSIVSGGNVTLTATISTNSNGESPCGSGVTNPGTVQFMNGGSAISGTVTYTGAQSSTGLASCTATLMTTLSALGIPDTTTPWRLKLPPGLIWLLGSCALLYGLFLWKMPRARRRGYVYAGLVVFALTAAGIAGCGGGGGSSKTPQSKMVTITAKFSGDSNYTASSGTTTVLVQ